MSCMLPSGFKAYPNVIIADCAGNLVSSLSVIGWLAALSITAKTFSNLLALSGESCFKRSKCFVASAWLPLKRFHAAK